MVVGMVVVGVGVVWGLGGAGSVRGQWTVSINKTSSVSACLSLPLSLSICLSVCLSLSLTASVFFSILVIIMN